MTRETEERARRKRAERLRRQIERLSSNKESRSEGTPAESPREFVERRMRELDRD